MAKKLTFIIVLLFALAVASVTAFATVGDNAENAIAVNDEKPVDSTASSDNSTVAYEEKYGDIFFGDKVSEKPFLLNINISRDLSGNNQLRYVVTGTVLQNAGATTTESVIMLMYIRQDEKNFIPLNKIDPKSETSINMVEGSRILKADVDLLHLGSDKVNDIRFMVLKKGDTKKLELGKNLQITPFQITVRNYNPIERIKMGFNDIMDLIKQ